MLDFIKTLFANASERIKNPLIGTFVMSWIVFNWKAILVLLFSSMDIEIKLTYLAVNFNNIGNLLYYPLTVALGYIFLLPYINLGIDKLLSDSNSKQHKIIQKKTLFSIEEDKEVEIAKIGLEEAKAEYRDREKQNIKIKELEGKIQSLEEDLKIEEGLKNKNMIELREENDKLTEIIENYNNQINKLVDANSKLQLNFTSDMEIGSLTLDEMKRIFTDIKKIQNILYKTKNNSNPIDQGKYDFLKFTVDATKEALEKNGIAQSAIDARNS